MKTTILIWILLAFSLNIAAKVEVHTFSTPEDESRYQQLVAELRCLVCQNQNIASSNADLAKDLRQQVYTRIKNGQTDEEIIAFMVDRYGEFVLYKPPLNARTALLWIGPFVLLAIGIWVMIRFIRSRNKEVPIPQQSVDRARDLLRKDHERL